MSETSPAGEPPAHHAAGPLPPPRSRIWDTVRTLLRTRIVAGLIVVLPVMLTVFVVQFVFGLMRDASQWVVYSFLRGEWLAVLPQAWRPNVRIWSESELDLPSVQWGIALVSVLLTITILYIVGLSMANIVGRRLLYLMESVVDRLPVIKSVYRATKQILATFAGDEAKPLQRVALMPFTSPQVRSIGFITRIFPDPQTGEELCAVFCPTTPNPTGGFILIVKRRDLVELDWSYEEAFKIIMSGGILLPDQIKVLSGAAAPASSPSGTTNSHAGDGKQ